MPDAGPGLVSYRSRSSRHEFSRGSALSSSVGAVYWLAWLAECARVPVIEGLIIYRLGKFLKEFLMIEDVSHLLQVLLFGVMAIEIKRKAPAAHTICEIVRARSVTST